MTHDEVVKKLFQEYKSANKKRYTDFFLSSLSDSKWNSGLYVYATMKTFPVHDFTERENDIDPECYARWTEKEKKRNRLTTPCSICSSYRKNIDNEQKYNAYYFTAGLNADSIYKKLYIMEKINRLENIPIIATQDFDMFKEIISHLKKAEPEAKIRDIHKQLKKASFYKTLVSKIKEDRVKQGASDAASGKLKSILETLGVCGILHTEKHLSSFYEYTNLAVAPRSSHSSDWSYPVDFWRGKNGIDWEAFKFWFGDYQELNDVIK